MKNENCTMKINALTMLQKFRFPSKSLLHIQLSRTFHRNHIEVPNILSGLLLCLTNPIDFQFEFPTLILICNLAIKSLLMEIHWVQLDLWWSIEKKNDFKQTNLSSSFLVCWLISLHTFPDQICPWVQTNWPVTAKVKFKHPCALIALQETELIWVALNNLLPTVDPMNASPLTKILPIFHLIGKN